MAAALSYLASAVLIAWGTAHLVPTRAVAASFGDITLDNRRILVMEWVAEGTTHISLGARRSHDSSRGRGRPGARLVYRVVAVVLVALAALTAATGSRTPVIWFRVCPYVLSGAAALLVAASLL